VTTIDPLTRAELQHNAATASLMAERRRSQWRTATPTSTRALALAREVRSWETQSASWTAVLALVDGAESAPEPSEALSEAFDAGHRTAEKEHKEAWGKCPYCGRSRQAALNPCTYPCPGYIHVHGARIPTQTDKPEDQEPCDFCGHPYHGPDTWDEMGPCSQVGCRCQPEKALYQ